MGWWTFPDSPSVWLGDEVMDATYDYLERLAELYHERFDRKPTIAELQAVLRLALRVRGEACIEDLPDERQVESVTVKSAPRPKRQKFRVGDTFAVPLDDGRYAFGRIMNLSDGWELVEIFAHIADTPGYSSHIARARRLLPPIWVNTNDVFGNWKWKIIQSDPQYAPADLDSLRYAMGTPGNYKWVKVDDFEPRGALSDAEAGELPQWKLLTEGSALKHIHEAASEQELL